MLLLTFFNLAFDKQATIKNQKWKLKLKHTKLIFNIFKTVKTKLKPGKPAGLEKNGNLNEPKIKP